MTVVFWISRLSQLLFEVSVIRINVKKQRDPYATEEEIRQAFKYLGDAAEEGYEPAIFTLDTLDTFGPWMDIPLYEALHQVGALTEGLVWPTEYYSMSPSLFHVFPFASPLPSSSVLQQRLFSLLLFPSSSSHTNQSGYKEAGAHIPKDRDVDKAFHEEMMGLMAIFEKYSRQGYPIASLLLGAIHEKGWGTQAIDLDKAIHYYTLAGEGAKYDLDRVTQKKKGINTTR